MLKPEAVTEFGNCVTSNPTINGMTVQQAAGIGKSMRGHLL